MHAGVRIEQHMLKIQIFKYPMLKYKVSILSSFIAVELKSKTTSCGHVILSASLKDKQIKYDETAKKII
jgi:hypothetical protein